MHEPSESLDATKHFISGCTEYRKGTTGPKTVLRIWANVGRFKEWFAISRSANGLISRSQQSYNRNVANRRGTKRIKAGSRKHRSTERKQRGPKGGGAQSNGISNICDVFCHFNDSRRI